MYSVWDDGTHNMDLIIAAGKKQQPIAASYVAKIYSPLLPNMFNEMFNTGLPTSSAVGKYKSLFIDAINEIY